MNKREYTTLREFTDIATIYSDCGNYELSFWNFVDYKKMGLVFKGIYDNGKQIWFEAVPQKDGQIKTVDDLKRLVSELKNHCSSDALILAVNTSNHHPMKAFFSGSSNVSKEVNFSVNYIDDHNKWKGELRIRWWTVKYKVEKFFKKIFKF